MRKILHLHYIEVGLTKLRASLGAFAWSQKVPVSFMMSVHPAFFQSVCLPVCLSVAPTGWISLKLDVGALRRSRFRRD
jgi:hypothetical protein